MFGGKRNGIGGAGGVFLVGEPKGGRAYQSRLLVWASGYAVRPSLWECVRTGLCEEICQLSDVVLRGGVRCEEGKLEVNGLWAKNECVQRQRARRLCLYLAVFPARVCV